LFRFGLLKPYPGETGRLKASAGFMRSSSMAGEARFTSAPVRLFSKRGNDLGFCFPDLVREIACLPIGDVILDGEITAIDRHGCPNFDALARKIHGERRM
jgi:hypothetical protein